MRRFRYFPTQSAELTGRGETNVIYRDDFESYETGEDALWKTLLGGKDLATNTAEKDAAAVRYDIAWCAGRQIVAGVGNDRFDPDGTLTAAAFAKMLLVAYGKGDAAALVGEQWVENTQSALSEGKMDEGILPVKNEPVTRENACRLAYNFLSAAEDPKPEK